MVAKYASAVTKNWGLGFKSQPCSEESFFGKFCTNTQKLHPGENFLPQAKIEPLCRADKKGSGLSCIRSVLLSINMRNKRYVTTASWQSFFSPPLRSPPLASLKFKNKFPSISLRIRLQYTYI